MFGCTWAAHWLRRGYCGCAWASFSGRGCTLAACLQPNGCNYWPHSNTYWLHVCSQVGCIHAASSAAYMQPVGCTMQPLFWLLFLALGCTWLRWSYRQLKMQPKSWLSAAGPAGRQRNIYIYILYIYIYYYTPLPLNVANKQQATTSKQQALLLTVLAIAPPHRSGLYSTLAMLEPRWWPCQIQVLSQKLTGGGPGRGRQVGRCPPKSAQFWAKKSHFSPKTAPKPGRNAQTKGYGEYTARAA